MGKTLLFVLLFTVFVVGYSFSSDGKFKLFSSDIENGKTILSKFTCQGENLSPELEWENVPKNAKSFVLIVDDPDAPFGTFVHWVIYNIPVSVNRLERGIERDKILPNGITQGVNDFGRIGYDGPCPPPGKPHRYYFKLYALDENLNLPPSLRKKDVLKKIEGHILAKAEIMGYYQRK